MANFNDTKDRRDSLMRVLVEERVVTQTWIHRKEIFAWTVLALYVAGSWTAHERLSCLDIYPTHLVFLFGFTFACLTLVYRNFKSIYYSSAKIAILNQAVYRLIEESEFPDDLDLSFGKTYQSNPNFIEDWINRNKVNKNPLTVLYDFSCYTVFGWLSSSKRDKIRDKIKDPLVLQEGAIYLLFCIVTFAVVGSLLL